MRRYIEALAAATTIIGAFVFALILTRSPHIPNTISDEEYDVYSAWTRSHFGKHPPDGQLYLLSRTFKFNPVDQTGACHQPTIGKAHVPASLTTQFAALGDAEYFLSGYPPTSLRLPWKYTVVDASPDLQPGAFHLMAFSRVAFNWNQTEALFAVSDACAAGDCGRGGVVYARKEQGSWTFQPTDCLWVY